MKLNDDVTFKRITVGDEQYFLQCQQKDCHGNGFQDVEVRLTNGSDVFSGKLTKDDVSMMKTLQDDNMSFDKLRDLLLQCLTLHSSTNQFAFQLTSTDDATYKLMMKQVLEGGIKFQLGHLDMIKTKKPSSNILSFLGHLTNQLTTLKEEVVNLRKKNISMENEQEEINKRLIDYVTAKDALENDLYTKFSLVLNEKKARIRELKDQVDSGVKVPRAPIQPMDDDIETDEEKEQQSKIQQRKKTKEEESTKEVSRTIDDIRLDDSIEDDDDLPQRSRKRIRASRPKTPTTSLMPRTTSLPRPKSTQGSSSSSSAKRRKSKEAIDPDGLLDDL